MKGGDEHDSRNNQRRIGPQTGEVITEADRLRARLKSFQWKIDRALSIIEEAVKIGRIGVSFSGGKDSVVLRDLILKVASDSSVIFFDSGCELQQTYDVINHYQCQVVKPEMDLLYMLRYGGYWGYQNPTDPNATFDFDEILIYEPARRATKEFDLSVNAIGLKAEESRGRFFNAKVKGELYFADYMNIWHLCPLQFWTTDDIWAYIASRGLEYNRAYDIMTQIGIPRDKQRICTVFGSDAATFGRYVYLKYIDHDLWNKLSAEFPKIRIYT